MKMVFTREPPCPLLAFPILYCLGLKVTTIASFTKRTALVFAFLAPLFLFSVRKALSVHISFGFRSGLVGDTRTLGICSCCGLCRTLKVKSLPQLLGSQGTLFYKDHVQRQPKHGTGALPSRSCPTDIFKDIKPVNPSLGKVIAPSACF